MIQNIQKVVKLVSASAINIEKFRIILKNGMIRFWRMLAENLAQIFF